MSFLFSSRKPAPLAKLALFGALVAAPALFFASPTASFAQSATSGALSGTISDASGALLPGTLVTVKSADTNSVKTVKSNSKGEYRVDNLTPGNYTVSFAADGFEGYQSDAVTVTVGNVASLSPKLKAGSVNDKVVVTDEAPQLHTQDNAISTTIDQNTIDNLPINGRRWSDFALLTPGVVSNSDGFGLLSFRGISYLLNNTTVDGADDNQAYFSEARGRTRSQYTVTQGAVQEFQVNTSNYSAEYGRAAGGVINTVTKSGGNKTHGEIFFYDRDNSFGGAANDYTQIYNFNENTGINPQSVKPKDRRLQFGFGIGGAIIKDKLFWFYAYDQSRRNFPGIARTSDPYDLFALATPLTGSEACAGANTTYGPTDYGAPYFQYTSPTGVQSQALYVTANLSTPATSVITSTGNSAAYPVGYSYQGNFGACALAAALNPSATTATATVNYQQAAAYYNQGLGVLASFFGQVPRFQNQAINFPKLDYQINDRNRMTVQYNRLRDDSPNGVQTQTSNFDGRGSYGSDFVKADVGIFRLSSVLTNSIVNTFLAQYGRDMETEFPSQALPNEQGLVKALPLGECSAPHGGNCVSASPDLSVGYGYDAEGFDGGTTALQTRFALPDERRLQLKDDVTYSRSVHTFKFGLDYNKVSDYINNLYNGYGTYDFDWAYSFVGDYLHKTTNLGGATYAGATYTDDGKCTSITDTYCEANFGLYSSYSQGFTVPKNYIRAANTGTQDNIGAQALMTTREYAGYATDDWRVTPRLTVTLGVRYEYEYVPSNPTPNPDYEGQTVLNTGTHTYSPNTLSKPDDRNNVAPRLGFSINVFGNGKTILRGGYGMYFGRIINSNVEQSYQNSGGPGSQVNVANLFPDVSYGNVSSGYCSPLLFGGNISTFTQAITCARHIGNASSNPSISYLDSHLQNPQVHEADLALEQDLGHGFVLGVTYMGSFGRELDSASDVNISSTNPPAYPNHLYYVNDSVGINPAQQNPVHPHGGKAPPLADKTTTKIDVYTGSRVDSNYYRILRIASNVNSKYDALAFSLNKRYKNGFSLLANYTWSHAMDYNPYIGTGIPGPTQLDPNNQYKDYGNSSLDVRNRFVMAFTYQPNTKFHGWKDQVLGGWRLAPVIQAQDGLPFTPYISGYPGESLTGVRGANGTGTSSGRIDGLRRNQYHLPGTVKADVRLGKNFWIPVNKFGMDRVRFELFGEVFNLANHQNVTGINNTAYNLSYGTVAGVANPNPGTKSGSSYDILTLQPNYGTNTNSNSNVTYSPRQLQISARLHF